MANRIKMVCRDRDCYCKPKKATHSASPPPPAVDLELLQRYVRLRENGKFLNLEINCSDGSSRSVHKFILNSLSVNLGRSILACKYSYHSKGQLILKQNCRAVTSPKKWKNEFVFLSWHSRNTWNLNFDFKCQVFPDCQGRKTNSFIRFWDKFDVRQFCFEIY